MPLPRSTIPLALLALLTTPGCQSAWPFGKGGPALPPAPGPALPVHVTESQASFTSPVSEPTAEDAFAQVLGELEELGQTDPAAQQQLLKQLQSARPAHYPLVVQQFKAAWAYSREMKERSQPEWSPNPLPAAQPASRGSEQPAPTRLPSPLGSLADPDGTRTADLPRPLLLPSAVAPPPESPSVTLATYALETAAAPSPTTPAPVAADMWEESLDRAIDQLTLATREPPQSTAEARDHLRLRLLELAAGRDEAAVRPIVGLSITEQDYWSKQLFALATLLDHQAQPDDKRRAAAASVHLAEATSKLGELGSLTVRNLAFCKEVHGYGAYEIYPATQFRPGQRVALYAEVDNYRSVSTPQGYHTSLATSYQVLDAQGGRVDGNEFPAIDDYCLRHRRDFHTQYGITLPARLTPGRYQLQLTIKDQLANKLGHATIDFDIAGN